MSAAWLSDSAMEALIVGGVSYLAAKGMGKDSSIVEKGGVEVGMSTYYGLAGAAGSIIGNSMKQYVLPFIPGNNENGVMAESTLIKPALTGAVNGALNQFLIGQQAVDGFIYGAGSQIAGSYIYSGVLKQYITPASQ